MELSGTADDPRKAIFFLIATSRLTQGKELIKMAKMEVVLKFSAVYVVIIHLIGRNLRPKAESRNLIFRWGNLFFYFQVEESLFCIAKRRRPPSAIL